MYTPPSPLDAPSLEWLHVMPPADSAELVLGYEAAYPFLLDLPAPPQGTDHPLGA